MIVSKKLMRTTTRFKSNKGSFCVYFRWRGYKILRKRTGTIIHDIIRTPNPFNHVYNLFNVKFCLVRLLVSIREV